MTEKEIRAMPLEEKQRWVVDLKKTNPGDKDYPAHKAIIDLIEADRKYKPARLIKVKALDNVTVDGRDMKKDQEAEVYPWQYHALARSFDLLDQDFARDLAEGSEAAGAKRKAQGAPPANTTDAKLDRIAELLEQLLASAGKKAALIAVLLGFAGMLAGPMTASAQPFKVNVIAGLNGGTNVLAGDTTVNYFVPTAAWTVQTNITWNSSNGVQYASYTVVSNAVTTIPGLLNLERTDNAEVSIGFTMVGTSNTVAATFYKSTDGTTNNAYPAFVLTAGSVAGTAGHYYAAGTNYNLGSAGWLILMSTATVGTGAPTNVTCLADTKPVRSGQ